MKSRFIFLLMVTLFYHVSNAQNAQETLPRSFQLSWGYGHLSRQDISFSPMVHKTWSPLNVWLVYESKKRRMNHLFDARFNLFKPSLTEPFQFHRDQPENVLNSYRHSFKQLEFNYRFTFPVLRTNKLVISMGGRQGNRLFASEYMYAISSSFSYYFSFGLDASIQFDYHISEKSQLKTTINSSILSFNTRSPYLGIDEQYLLDNYSHNGVKALFNYIGHAKLQTLNKAQDLDLSIAFERVISSKWSFNFTYDLNLNFNQSPTQFSSIQNSIFLGAKLKI